MKKNNQMKGRALINDGIKKMMEKRKAELESNPVKSKYFHEPVQPAFKHHMKAIAPPTLPLGEGTKNMINSQYSGIRRKKMEELESVTTRENASVLLGSNEANNVANLDYYESRRMTSDFQSKIKRKKRGMTLPIHHHEDEILKEIENNQTLVIQGSTGCGKSTQLPQFILDDCARKDEPVHIIITQPRRIAAISLAMHVANERGWEVGSYVGYQVGLDRKVGRETVITYVTTGVLLELLIHNKTLTDFTHIILDEVHERDVDMDLLLSVVKELLMHDQKTKVLLMSATVVAEKFSCYFSKQIDPENDLPLPGPIFRISGKMFPVEEFFLDDLSRLGICQEAKAFEESNATPRLTAEIKEIIYQLLMYITQMELIESNSNDLRRLEMGSVLIFLPGLNEITDLNEYLMMGINRESCVNSKRRDLFYSSTKYAPIFPLKINNHSMIAKVLREPELQRQFQDTFYLLALHSSIGMSDQRRAFDNPQRGRRKIILSTNIAESSITVKDIQYVIDLCMIKRLRYDRETHFSSLQTEWTSKSSCKQRSGRAGRVRNGVVYRLIGQTLFNQLEDYCPPEILTGPLTQVILRIKEFGREPRSLLQRAMDCPSIEDIGYTFLTLKEAGALCVRRKEVTRVVNDKNGSKQVTVLVMPVEDHWQGDLTFIGRFISSLPMDLHMGKLIALGYAFDVLEESIIIASCLTVSRSIFLQPLISGHVKNPRFTISPNQTRILDAFEKRLRLSEGKNSDLLTMLNSFKLWYQRTKTGAFQSRSDERRWCEEMFLDFQALREVECLIEELKRRLKERFNIQVMDLSKLESKVEDDETFFNPNENKTSAIFNEAFKKSFRTILLQMTIAGAFYPNYFLRTHNTFSEDDGLRTFDGIDPFVCVEIGNLPMDQGNLYRHSIAKHFQRYTMKYSQDMPTVICRNTKAIIKFPSNSTNTLKTYGGEPHDSLTSTSTNLSVILAVKMGTLSSLKPKITVYELTVDERSQVKKLSDVDRIKNNQILPLNYKYVSGDKNFIGFPNIDCNYLKVFVTFANECGTFYGIYEDEKHQEEKLFGEIFEFTSNSKNVKTSPVNVGDICLAPFDGEYYRAKVISKQNSNISVFFVDYGNFATINSNQIIDIPDYIHYYCPFLAVKFVLSEIKPHVASHPDSKWNEFDRNKFLDFVLDYTTKPLVCKVYSVVDNSVRIKVEMTSHQNRNLNEELIQLGIAERCEEAYLSRQDASKRIKITNEQNYDLFTDKFIKNTKIYDDAGSSTGSDSQTDCGADNDTGYDAIIRDVVRRNPREDLITLSSPHHPFLMKFHGLAESCRRPVTIAPESVNSIIVDQEPQNHLTRLLTAACVQSQISSNPEMGGNDLLLRYTTLLPYIPGLPFIIALIFTPYAELISDKRRTRYIGARCGLGYDADGRPLHPSNDMDIKTDVRFDESDLKHINGIRSLLNITLGSTSHSQDVMERYQCGIKKFLASLFNCTRDLVNNENIEEYCNLTPDLWHNSTEYSNKTSVTDINRIFITHQSIDGICRRRVWVHQPILNEPKTERSKSDWLRRFVLAADDNLKDLNLPIMPMTRVKMCRDVLPYVKICEICSHVNYARSHGQMPIKGIPLYTESQLEDHIHSQEHQHQVQQLRQILNI